MTSNTGHTRDVEAATIVGTVTLGASTANIGDVDVLSIAAGETHIGEFGGWTSIVAATFTRPNDTTAYAISDAVSDSAGTPTALTFTNAVRINGASGYVVKARIMTNQSTNTAQFRLHLFNASPTAINDNSPYTLLWANRAARLGSIDLPSCSTEGAGSDCANALNSIIRLALDSGAATRNLFGLLETKTAFTPAANQQFYIEIGVESN